MEDPKDKNKTLKSSDIIKSRVGRRSAIRALGGSLLGAAALVGGAMTAGTAKAQEADELCSDSDPNDPVGRGSSCSDPGGGGAHCSDSDPNDPANGGRSCSDSD